MSKELADKIIDIVNYYHDPALTLFKRSFPEICGDREMCLFNESIMIISGVNIEFVDTLSELVNENVLKLIPVPLFSIIYDGGEVYDLPIANNIRLYKKKRWLPIVVAPDKNFPVLPFRSML